MLDWIEAWKLAVTRYWPHEKPEAVRFLLSIARSIVFRAPEQWHLDVTRAWDVFQDFGDNEIGRCAVALAYAIGEERRAPNAP